MSDTAPPAASSLGSILKVLGVVLGGATGVGIVWFAGFLWFVATLPSRVDDPDTHTDAIVVLTGGSARVATGLTLLEDGKAGRVFISGVHRGVDVAEILRLVHSRPPDLAGSIVLGHDADDTVGNAVETAAWVAAEKLESVRLVTGAYHMPRALAEFRHAMPVTAIVPNPVFPSTVKSREWWRWPGTAALLATEYSKYLAAVARHWILPKRPSP